VATIVVQPEDKFRLGDFLTRSLNNPDWTEFRGAVAFAKRSGTRHIREALRQFTKRASVNLSVGINSGGTSAEGLEDLIAAVLPAGKLWIFHNPNGSTFHPKVFLFKNIRAADLIIGSGNLTEGGLYTNYEAGVRLMLERSDPAQQEVLKGIEAALDRWSTHAAGTCLALDATLLKKLVESGKVPVEALARETEESASATGASAKGSGDALFRPKGVPAAPRAPTTDTKRAKPAARSSSATAHAAVGPSSVSLVSTPRSFVMTLHKTDMGYGQTSKGTAPRSAEIFVPMRAVDMEPAFWGWPTSYTVDKAWVARHAKEIAKKAKSRRTSRPLEKMDREKVRIKVTKTNRLVEATIWFNPEKVDLRIRHKELREAGNVGDILVLSKTTTGESYDYNFNIIPPTDGRFPALLKACGNKVASNSKKRFGYI
jgi:HKD family nuclease